MSLPVGGASGLTRENVERVELGATFDCDLCMPYEDDNPIWVCRGLRGSVDELWRRAKKFI